MAANPFGTTIQGGATSFYDFSQNNDGQQPVATTLDDGGNGGSSSSTTTTTTTTTSPYAQFKGNNYEELEQFLRGQMESIKPETKEEREKREKREKRVGFLARLAEGLGTFHTAFSHARGIKAMDMPKMSAKAKELFEKAKAQRDKDNDRLVNYATALGNIKDKDRAFNFQKEQAERQQANWQATFDRQAARDQEEDRRWQISFDEGVRQFNVTSERQKQQLALEGRRLALQQKQGQMSFNLGPGKGNVTLSSEQLNAETVSRIYHTLPQDVRDKVHGKPIYTKDMLGNQVISGYGDPTTEAMLIAIGANVQNSTETQDAIREVAGQKVPKRNIEGF